MVTISLRVVGKDKALALRREGWEGLVAAALSSAIGMRICHRSVPAVTLRRTACRCEASCWYSADHVGHHGLQLG